MSLTSAGSFALQKEKVSGGRMDLNDKKKKALELMKARRPAPPPSQPMPSDQAGAPQEDEAPAAPSRFAAAIAKKRGK